MPRKKKQMLKSINSMERRTGWMLMGMMTMMQARANARLPRLPPKNQKRTMIVRAHASISSHFSHVARTALASDPEAVRVRDWRHKLQKTFLNDKGTGPKPEVRISHCWSLFLTHVVIRK